MSGRNSRSWVQPVVAAAILLGAFTLIWAMAPVDLRAVLLLVGGVITVALYLGIFAVQRARHW